MVDVPVNTHVLQPLGSVAVSHMLCIALMSIAQYGTDTTVVVQNRTVPVTISQYTAWVEMYSHDIASTVSCCGPPWRHQMTAMSGWTNMVFAT